MEERGAPRGAEGVRLETSAPEGFSGVELIGRGATSHVYRATERATGRQVALKRLHRHLVRSAEALARLRRHRRIRREAARIFSELDPARFSRLGARTVPARMRVAISVALPPPSRTDAFVAAGARRTAELAPLLPDDALASLEAQLASLDRHASERRADASLLARCLLETDPDQQARFDFLALEGRLEAQAALAWASRTPGR